MQEAKDAKQKSKATSPKHAGTVAPLELELTDSELSGTVVGGAASSWALVRHDEVEILAN
jgi:hypothetical protein